MDQHADSAKAEIVHLREQPTAELRSLWRKLYRKDAPARIRREFLIAFLAYRIQELKCGGLKHETKKRLRQLTTAPSRGASNAVPDLIRPGIQLLREWHGERHEVCVTDSGFEYRGEIYKSLSQIARRITGTQWSGPAFFGLRKPASAPEATA